MKIEWPTKWCLCLAVELSFSLLNTALFDRCTLVLLVVKFQSLSTASSQSASVNMMLRSIYCTRISQIDQPTAYSSDSLCCVQFTRAIIVWSGVALNATAAWLFMFYCNQLCAQCINSTCPFPSYLYLTQSFSTANPSQTHRHTGGLFLLRCILGISRSAGAMALTELFQMTLHARCSRLCSAGRNFLPACGFSTAMIY